MVDVLVCCLFVDGCDDWIFFFFFKQKTAYEVRISDWSSDVCSSDLFWLERSPEGIVTVYALLDGPSVTGAYRFVNRQGTDEMTQDISAVIHLRDAVERLGIAPQTSMFWYGEGNLNPKRDWTKKDWRPEIHDSDGLAIRTDRKS